MQKGSELSWKLNLEGSGLDQVYFKSLGLKFLGSFYLYLKSPGAAAAVVVMEEEKGYLPPVSATLKERKNTKTKIGTNFTLGAERTCY